MKQNDKEHQAFEAYREKQKLNGDMHPLHLLYLDGETQLHLEIFKAGYKANALSPSAQKVIEAGIRLTKAAGDGDAYVLALSNLRLHDAVIEYQKETP